MEKKERKNPITPVPVPPHHFTAGACPTCVVSHCLFDFFSPLQIYGKISEYDGYERFEWEHSYARVYKPREKYSSNGIFMSFEHYNVEVRDRVKCISGIEGLYAILFYKKKSTGRTLEKLFFFVLPDSIAEILLIQID